MNTDGTMEAWLNQREEFRRRLGQSTFICVDVEGARCLTRVARYFFGSSFFATTVSQNDSVFVLKVASGAVARTSNFSP